MRLTLGLMFVCKARNLTLNGAPERSFTLLGSNLTHKQDKAGKACQGQNILHSSSFSSYCKSRPNKLERYITLGYKVLLGQYLSVRIWPLLILKIRKLQP